MNQNQHRLIWSLIETSIWGENWPQKWVVSKHMKDTKHPKTLKKNSNNKKSIKSNNLFNQD
jgi:hypothetical protein